MDSRVFKVIKRNDSNNGYKNNYGTIAKKTTYISSKKFKMYAPETIERWGRSYYQEDYKVEVYELIDDKWAEINYMDVIRED